MQGNHLNETVAHGEVDCASGVQKIYKYIKMCKWECTREEKKEMKLKYL